MTWAQLREVAGALLAALRRRRRRVWRLAAWSPVEALPVLLAGQLTARATDQGFLAGRPGEGLGWLGLLATAVLVGAYGTYRVHRCLAEVVEPFRDELLHRTVAGALHHSTRPLGLPDTAAVARLTHQIEIIRDTFAGLVMVTRGFLFTAGAAMLGLLSLAPEVVLLVTPPLLAGLLLFGLSLPRMVTWQRRYVHADERLAEQSAAVIRGRRDVAASGAEDRVAESVGSHIDAQARAERALARMAAVRGVCLAVGGWLPLIILLAGAPWLVNRSMTTGAILGALVYVLHGLQPALYTLVRGFGGGGLRLVVTLDRLLSATRPPPAPPQPGPRPSPGPGSGRRPGPSPRPGPASHPGTGQLVAVLRGVTFRYGPHSEPVLRDLHLTVGATDHLAIVGPSGIGKSTLTGLLAGVLRPQAGQVQLAGGAVGVSGPVDPAALLEPGLRLDPGALARLRVLIPQEAYLVRGTLWENLTYLAPQAEPAWVEQAVRELGLTGLLDRLGGFQGELSPASLSVGERQLVALARAYLAGSQLVLLDEATCHLDPPTEAHIEHAFARRPGALVVVAHRISSAVRAQRVMLMDGTHVSIGTHAELLAGSPRYRELVGHWHSTPAPA